MNLFVLEIWEHSTDDHHMLYNGHDLSEVNDIIEFCKGWFRKNRFSSEGVSIEERKPDCKCDVTKTVYIFTHSTKYNVNELTVDRRISYSLSITSCDCKS